MTPDEQIHAILKRHSRVVPEYHGDLYSTGILIAWLVQDGNRISLEKGKQHYTMVCVSADCTHTITRWGKTLTKLVAGVFLDRYAHTLEPVTIDARPQPERSVIALHDTTP